MADENEAQEPEPQEPAPAETAEASHEVSQESSSEPESGVQQPSPTDTPSGSPPQPSWREQLQSQGVGLPDSDEEAMAALVQSARELQRLRQVEPYAQAFQQHAPQFMEYLRGQEKAATPAAPQEQSWDQGFWNPPEFNPAWEKLLKRDEQGNIVAVPGAPPDIVPKFLAYAQYQNDFVERFRSSPTKTLQPIIDARAEQIAEKAIKKHLAALQETQATQQFLQEHSSWLYEKDANGQVRHEPQVHPITGVMQNVPVLSSHGKKFQEEAARIAQQQQKRGYSDIEEQKRLAMQQIQLDYALAEIQRLKGQPTAGPGQTVLETTNQKFLKQNNAPGKKRPGSNSATTTPQVNNRINLEQAMREVFQENGNPTVE